MESKTRKLLESANSDDQSSISFAERVFPNSTDAKDALSKLKRKILKLSEWNKNSGLSSYRLFDETGREISDETIIESVFIRILLKGSGKYDWVKVIEISESDDEMIITVKPSFDPTDDEPDHTRISHFFTDESSNNFCLLRKKYSIGFYVIGLREKQNTSETANLLETVRNIAAASVGSYLGIQKSEWKTFCTNFLEKAG